MFKLRYLVLIGFFLLSVVAMAVDISQKMVIVNRRAMISLRDFAETFDAAVDYQVDQNEISITLDNTTVYMVPNQMTAKVNDRKVWLDMPVLIQDDITYLPLRFMCDTFRLRCDWNEDNHQVIIINQWTEDRIIVIIDPDWDRNPHVWQQNYDYHWYVNFHTSHNNDWNQRDKHTPSADGNKIYENDQNKTISENGNGQHNGGNPQGGHNPNNNDGAIGHGNPGNPDANNTHHGTVNPPNDGMKQRDNNNPGMNGTDKKANEPQTGGGDKQQKAEPQNNGNRRGSDNQPNATDKKANGPQSGGGDKQQQKAEPQPQDNGSKDKAAQDKATKDKAAKDQQGSSNSSDKGKRH